MINFNNKNNIKMILHLEFYRIQLKKLFIIVQPQIKVNNKTSMYINKCT